MIPPQGFSVKPVRQAQWRGAAEVAEFPRLPYRESGGLLSDLHC